MPAAFGVNYDLRTATPAQRAGVVLCLSRLRQLAKELAQPGADADHLHRLFDQWLAHFEKIAQGGRP
jgi:hypothetical protein